jgi:cytosine/adenosine deaminase-related metal-dependent hydrolase
MRATIGKCMMDFDAQVPRRLQEETRQSIDESVAIAARWDGAANGRLHAAFAPRFAVSCSRELLEAVASLSISSTRWCTRTPSESREEIAIVQKRPGAHQHRVPRERAASPRRSVRRRNACGWTIGISSCWPITTSR